MTAFLWVRQEESSLLCMSYLVSGWLAQWCFLYVKNFRQNGFYCSYFIWETDIHRIKWLAKKDKHRVKAPTLFKVCFFSLPQTYRKQYYSSQSLSRVRTNQYWRSSRRRNQTAGSSCLATLTASSLKYFFNGPIKKNLKIYF